MLWPGKSDWNEMMSPPVNINLETAIKKKGSQRSSVHILYHRHLLDDGPPIIQYDSMLRSTYCGCRVGFHRGTECVLLHLLRILYDPSKFLDVAQQTAHRCI